MAHELEVGSILSSSWGYDQTNVDYYKVIRRTPCTVDVVKVGNKVERSELTYDYVIPDTDRVIGDVMKCKRVRNSSIGPAIYLNSYSDAYLWNGEAKYKTAWGYGH
jgi:hypothetical protein